MLKGEFTLEDDPSNHWMSLITHRYVPKERADQLVEKWAKGNMVLMRFKVAKVARV